MHVLINGASLNITEYTNILSKAVKSTDSTWHNWRTGGPGSLLYFTPKINYKHEYKASIISF